MNKLWELAREEMKDYEKAKKKIFFDPIRGKSAKNISEVVACAYLPEESHDVVLLYAFYIGGEDEDAVHLFKHQVDEWGVDPNIVATDAWNNTAEMFPNKIIALQEYYKWGQLDRWLDEEHEEEDNNDKERTD